MNGEKCEKLHKGWRKGAVFVGVFIFRDFYGMKNLLDLYKILKFYNCFILWDFYKWRLKFSIKFTAWSYLTELDPPTQLRVVEIMFTLIHHTHFIHHKVWRILQLFFFSSTFNWKVSKPLSYPLKSSSSPIVMEFFTHLIKKLHRNDEAFIFIFHINIPFWRFTNVHVSPMFVFSCH